jgi:hypothetical protein
MKAVTWRVLKCFDNQEVEREIEEQLHFHLELLTQANLQQDMSFEEARRDALKRFGDVEQIKGQCVQISKRSHPFMRALKAFLLLLFLTGVLLRVFSTELTVTRVGDLLIVVPILGRLLLYVRGLDPSSFVSKDETSSPLMLIEKTQPSIAVYDQRNLTPVERVISDR